MAAILKEIAGTVQYRDRRCPFHNDAVAYARALATTTTVYVGNLAFTTREEQLYEVFGKVGPVDRVIMGLNQKSKQPCGFAFVIYYSHLAAAAASSFVSGTKLDHRVIRVDLDWGFQEGRQFGRGISGGQVRDEYRSDFDPGRGGENPMNTSYNEGMGYTGHKRQRRDTYDRRRSNDVPRGGGANGGAPPPPPPPPSGPNAPPPPPDPKRRRVGTDADASEAKHGVEAEAAMDVDAANDGVGKDSSRDDTGGGDPVKAEDNEVAAVEKEDVDME